VTLKSLLIPLLASVGLISTAPSFSAAEMILYRGETAASQGLGVSGWGSGWINESQKYFYTNTNSLEVTTNGYYAGGRIDFLKPVDLTDAFADPQAYLVLLVRFPAIADEGEEFGATGPEFGPRGSGVPGQNSGTATGVRMGFLRVAAVVNGQQLIAEDQPVDVRRTEAGWTSLSFPLRALKGNRPTGRALLSRLIISGDRPEVFYIGEIRTAIDETDIYLEESPEEQTVSPGDLVQFVAQGAAGLANIEYVWDFNKTDGLQEDAFGELAYHTWREPGEYTVTLRIRDINGVKPTLQEEVPVTVSF